MILLDAKNPIVEQILLDRFDMAAQGEFISTELTMSDFDGVQYTIRNPGDKLSLEQQQQGGLSDHHASPALVAAPSYIQMTMRRRLQM